MPDPVKIADLNKETSFADDDSFVFSDSSAGLDKRIEGSDIRKNISADIENVTALKLFEGTRDGQIVWLNGYGEEGDGGEGVVRWDASSTETANDVNIFQVTGVATGRWKRPVTERIHLAWAGVTESGDETAKLVNALAVADSESKPLSLDGLDIEVVGEIDVPSVTIYGEGGSITSDGTAFVLRAAGTADTYYSNDLLAKKGDSWIVNASLAAEVSKGDLVQIQSDEKKAPNIPPGSQGHTTTWGEMHLVDDVVGDIIHFEVPLFHTYKSLDESATDTRARKVTPTLFNIYDTKINQNYIDGASGVIVSFGYKNDIQISTEDCKNISVRVNNSYRVIVDSRSSATNEDGAGYGVTVSGCSMFTQVKGTHLNCRHAFATQPSGTDGASWGTLVEGVIGGAASVEHNHSIFDTHTDCGSIHFKNCIGLGTADKTLTSVAGWDDAEPYSIGNDVYADDGYYYRSLTDSNLNNDPVTDDGTNWLAIANSNGALFGFRGGDIEITNCAGTRLKTGVSLATNRTFEKVHINGLYMDDMCREGVVPNADCEIESLLLNNIHVSNSLRWDHTGAVLNFTEDCTIDKLTIGNITGENIALLNVSGVISGIDEIIINNADVSNLETLKGCAEILDASIQRLIINNMNVSGFSGIVVATVAMERIEINNFHVKDTGSVLVNSSADVDVISLNGGSYERRAGGSNRAMVLLNGTTYDVVRLTNIDVPNSADVTGAIENNGTITKLYRMGNEWNGNALYASGSTAAALEILSGDRVEGGVYRGAGTPEGNVTANRGSIYQRTDGGAGTSIYVQEAASGNTGWVAK